MTPVAITNTADIISIVSVESVLTGSLCVINVSFAIKLSFMAVISSLSRSAALSA